MEDQADPLTADLVELLFRKFSEVHAAVEDFAGLDDGVRRQDPHYGLDADGLSRARLAHNSDGLSPLEVKADPSYRLDNAAVRPEVDPQVFDL